ncbi:hypothetical protein [Leptobacterium sp. I13]|uniref:hypothetical protein n=1 Tax=Leptobacterium meishanense TaxID=3128904 RepID=UPI0030EF4844
MKNESLHKVKLSILYEISSLTSEGILIWECVEVDTRFLAKYEEYQFEVEFIRLLRTDETGSDKMIASIQIMDIVEDFSIGTEGFDLIVEIIANSQPEWKPSWEKGKAKLIKNLNILRAIKK